MNILFIVKLKILWVINWSYRSPPQLCWLLSLEGSTHFEHIVQSLLNTSLFWCPFLDSLPTINHSNIGDRFPHIYLNKESSMFGIHLSPTFLVWLTVILSSVICKTSSYHHLYGGRESSQPKFRLLLMYLVFLINFFSFSSFHLFSFKWYEVLCDILAVS